MDNIKILVNADTVAEVTSLTIEEILILTKEGIFIKHFNPDDSSAEYDIREIHSAVKLFDKIIVTRDGLDPNLGYKISWPIFDSIHPGESQIKPVGYDWSTGRALFRFSDMLEWRKAHHFNPFSKKFVELKRITPAVNNSETTLSQIPADETEANLDLVMDVRS